MTLRVHRLALQAGLLLSCSLTVASWATGDTVYGPKRLVRTTGSPNVFTESFVVCRPTRGFQLRVENGPDGAVKIASGAVALNGVEIIAAADFNQQVALIERSVQLKASNTLTVLLAGTPKGTAQVRVVSDAGCGPEITISDPPAGAVVPAGTLLVRGTVNAPDDVGVGVNGFPALISGSRWAAEIPVHSNTQLLAATASVIGGESTTVGTPVNISPDVGQLLRLQAEPADGVPPFTVTWRVSNDTGRQLVQYELDPTGDGAFGLPAPTLDGTRATYSTPGLWFPVLRVTDDQGTTYTTTTVVLASDPGGVTARFRALWAGFKSRLQIGDLAGALSFLAPTLQSRLEPVFQQLGADLPAVVTALGDVHVTDQAGDLAEAVLLQDEASGPALYFIQFRRDGLGRWLIEEM